MRCFQETNCPLIDIPLEGTPDYNRNEIYQHPEAYRHIEDYVEQHASHELWTNYDVSEFFKDEVWDVLNAANYWDRYTGEWNDD